MRFAENLKQIRKEHGLTQEDLADLMGVSRQAVSKWEQGEIYPEVEKLVLLAKKFHVSLDQLLSTEITGKENGHGNPVTGRILISSPTEHVVASFCKVASSQKMKGGNRAPQYALFGVSTEGQSFWGNENTLLGWYADQESLSKEVHEIQQAMMQGLPSYELKYSVTVEKNFLRISMVQEERTL